MLFDHGCDSWTIGMMVTMTGKVLVINDANLFFLYTLECVCLFYFGTLEEYYVGGLHLRPGNGISDGCWPIFGILAVLSYTGPGIMQHPLIEGNEHTRISTLIVYFCLFFAFRALAENFYAIFTKPADSQIGEKIVYKKLIIQIFSYFLIIALLQSLAYIGNEPIIN